MHDTRGVIGGGHCKVSRSASSVSRSRPLADGDAVIERDKESVRVSAPTIRAVYIKEKMALQFPEDSNTRGW